MPTRLAFLQTGEDAFACIEGGLGPQAGPGEGAPALFAPDFALSRRQPAWYDAGDSRVSVVSRNEWADRFPVPAERARMPAWHEPDEPRFARAFELLRGRLDAGTLRKGVPVAVMSAAFPAGEAAALFASLVSRVPALPPGVLAYGLFFADGGAGNGEPEFVIGATPELLFDLRNGSSVATMAVAGTRPAVDDPARLASSAKDLDEHRVVVDNLEERLSRWGAPVTSPTGVRRFGQLAHLVTDIRVESDATVDFEAAARWLHPTPALGVLPRGAVGEEWLSGVDPRGDRKRFGAPFGIRWPSGDGRCVVAIRCVQYTRGLLEIWAGSGVVSMSRYEDEWDEVLQKMQAVRALWGV